MPHPLVRAALVRAAVIFCIGSFAGLAPVRAAVLYVDPNAPGPRRDGITWQTAFLTIHEALNGAAPGDTVRVSEGSFGESLSLPDGVALLGGFPGVADPGGARDPRLHLTLLPGDGSNVPVVMVAPGAGPGAVLDGFNIQTDGSYAVYCAGASPTITNNVFQFAGAGVTCGAGGAPRIQDNIFSGCGYGIFASGAAPVIAGNLVLGSEEAIHVSGTGAPLIVSNTVANNATGISLTDGAPVLANNIIALNGTGLHGLRVSPDMRSNDVYGNATDFDGVADPGGRNGNIAADPRFVNASYDDYHLSGDSPCIDAGDNSSVIGTKDLDGSDRVLGLRVDIGAYETAGAAPPDPATALRLAAGLGAAGPEDMARYDVEAAPPSTGAIDILDAVRLARRAAGL